MGAKYPRGQQGQGPSEQSRLVDSAEHLAGSMIQEHDPTNQESDKTRTRIREQGATEYIPGSRIQDQGPAIHIAGTRIQDRDSKQSVVGPIRRTHLT